jgi:methylenetetrahydrofolate/methylenetetrahydromethanopterin dehydrogenase (NADP+)
MSLPKILVQLDTDAQPSVFDRVVAVDSGVEQLFSYGGVTAESAVPLVHGAMFTRGPKDLAHTAIFVGGGNVEAGEAVFAKVRKTLFPPLTVSVMMDSNGSNTTAAAAVLCAAKHLADGEGRFGGATAVVLGGTGPVGFRAAQLLARCGANVRVGSRTAARAEEACKRLRTMFPDAELTPVAAGTTDEVASALQGARLVIAAGAAGVELIPEAVWKSNPTLQVLIDLNAYPPLGIAGIAVTEKGVEKAGKVCYGAIGVGGLKMKIHKAAVQKLFERNDQVLDTEAIFQVGVALVS